MQAIRKFIILLFILSIAFSAEKHTDANIIGDVQSNDEHLPFVNIVLKGTTIGTATDETGHFSIIHAPVGNYTLVISYMGYKTKEIAITTKLNTTIEKKIVLEEDVLHMSDVIVSASRYVEKRVLAPMPVDVISLRMLEDIQTVSISEGLNYTPGLRVENNCQNCGFSQVRMNGMEGSYSQILINGFPIFSGLAGVYGLELIPSNIIEQIEIVKGGGSAMYGSNAIAGTINLILKDPVTNTYEAGISVNQIGSATNGNTASDYSVKFNTSVVSPDKKTGLALYGFSRERGMYDANGDSFSEIAPMENLTMGTRIFHRFGYRNKLSIDFFNIREKRDGGNMQNHPLHERDIAEALQHNLKSASISFDQYFRESDNLKVFAALQDLNRDSYYGAEQSLSDYGNTKDLIYNFGLNYNAVFNKIQMITGIEHQSDKLTDTKLGYPDLDSITVSGDVPHRDNTIISNQRSLSTGLFSQWDISIRKLKLSMGLRFEHYDILDLTDINNNKSGNVLSPRVGLLYSFSDELQARLNYSNGYRAPQVFDEDLHIETSGVRQVIHVNADDLKQENSHTYMTSLDLNKIWENIALSLTMEGFYTRLLDPFVNEIGETNDEGVVVYTRTNAESGATVKGLNMEFFLQTRQNIAIQSGFTLQSSAYDEAQEFNETKFFRTPDSYGYFSLNWDILKDLSIVTTGTYTGKMLVPYFGNTLADPEEGELRTSPTFFDIGAKISYTIQLNGSDLQIYSGIKNILNSFQSDYDLGIDRDPAYIYGPVMPKTIYIGLNIGNNL
ncbi:MAG: TonB-dependent receptor [Candidatus Marinimicrobia bacterium]|nr:TonB-dependent receptor [Candidatus Neomarinimicrobiota bacterium]